MGLESPSFVNDFVSTNPDGTDARSQGDDHIRNMKSALKATFPSASKAFFFPTATTKSADFTVTSTDENKTFYIDASAPSTSLQITLPSLTSTNSGWACTFIKIDTAPIPLILLPSSGSLQSGFLTGLARVRRAVTGAPFHARWTGTTWLIDRCFFVPLGTVLDNPVTSLPPGTEWANGQTLTSSLLYPEFNSVNSGLQVVDRRGRASFGRDDMGGSAAGRITTASSGVNGASMSATGGEQVVTLTASNVPQVSGVTTSTVTPPTVSHFARGITTAAGSVNIITDASNQTLASQSQGFFTTASNYNHTHTVTVGNASPTSVLNLPPMMISNHIIVVE